MAGRLYPLNALRAFEAAARHLSFVKAAEELHVTPGAVSHQVKGLEEFLDVQLFRRLPQRVLLTDAGQILYPELRDGFLHLDKAVERLNKVDAEGALTISVAPVFAAKWLVPRLQRFHQIHQEIDVRISASLKVVDFQGDAFDAAIRLGEGQYPGLEAVKLFDEALAPMCSPRLLEGDNPMRGPQDLHHQVLLHDDSLSLKENIAGWGTWLEAAGVKDVDLSRGPHFDHPDHTIQAAIEGVGVALGLRYLARDDLAAGRLVEPFELKLPLNLGFYLVYPETSSISLKLAKFKEWVVNETQ